MDLIVQKGFFSRAIGLLLSVLMVVFVTIVGLMPQQALADTSLRAGLIAGFGSNDSSDDESDSLLLQPQGFSDGVYTSTNVYLLNNAFFRPSDNFDPADYSDGQIAVRFICDPSVGYQVEIVGVVDGTWLKVPESIPARVAAQNLYFDAWMMWEDYRQGNYSDESIAFMDYVLEDDWRNVTYPGNKESIYTSDETALFVKMTNSASGYSFAGIETLSFEEVPNSANLQELYIDGAFNNCDSLTSVTFPSYRKYGLKQSFAGCDGLTSIKLTSSMDANPSAGFSASCFSNCANLETVDLSELQGVVPAYAFYNCSKLQNVQLGLGVTGIGESSFEYCTSLESIVLPNSVSSIDSRAFAVCSHLKNVTWPKNPNFTKVDGFTGCSSLGNEVIESLPESVVSIGSDPTPLDLQKSGDEGAFAHCGFTSLTIPESISTIGAFAFYDCPDFSGQTITIPSGVDTLGHKAFSVSSSMAGRPASITLKFENPDFSFTPIGDTSIGNVHRILDSNSDTATAFYNPFGDTYVTFDASETGQNGEKSLLKQAYDSYYVYEEDGSSGGTIEPMSTRVLPYSEYRNEYQFKTKPVVTPKHLVTGTVPWSASVSITRSGETIYAPTFFEFDGDYFYGVFEVDVPEGGDVQVCISIEGKDDITFEKDAASFTEDWDVCNVVIFDTGEGAAFEEQVVEVGSAATLPNPAPSRAGYRLAYWYENSAPLAAYNFAAPVNEPITLHAKWVKQWTVAASSADAQKGFVKIGTRDAAASDSFTVDEGDTVSVTAVPAEGYHFSSWSSGGTPLLGSQATFTQNIVTSDLALVANFEKDEYPVDPEDPSGEDDPSGGDEPAATATITVVGGDGGALVGGTVTGAGVHEIGSLVTLTAAPDQGYEFRGWKSEGDIELIPANDVLNETAARILQVMATGDDEYLSTDSSIRFRVTGDATIQAIFEGVQSDPQPGADPEPEDNPQPSTDPEPVVDPQPGADDPESGVDPQPSVDNPDSGNDPQPGTDNPEQGDSPSQGNDPSKSDDPEKTTDPEKSSTSDQGKDSEKENSVDSTDGTTKATSTTTTKVDAAKGSSAPATGDMALTFAINALSVVVLTALLFIAFRRRVQ